VESDLALVGALEPGQETERRGLAAARGPEDGEELAGPDVERNVVERDRVAVALPDSGEADRGSGGAYGILVVTRTV